MPKPKGDECPHTPPPGSSSDPLPVETKGGWEGELNDCQEEKKRNERRCAEFIDCTKRECQTKECVDSQ